MKEHGTNYSINQGSNAATNIKPPKTPSTVQTSLTSDIRAELPLDATQDVTQSTSAAPNAGVTQGVAQLKPQKLNTDLKTTDARSPSPESLSAPAIARPPTHLSVVEGLVKLLEQMGVETAFGVAGGAMASLWAALSNSAQIQVLHCRHEAGAAFAATEAAFAGDRPVVAFTTAGPGITNALTGLFAAKGEGAKVILLSACTSAAQRGRWAIQETSAYTLPTSGLFTTGALFDYAVMLESANELPQVGQRLALGLSQPGGFVAHISIPTGIQSETIEAKSLPVLSLSALRTQPSPAAIDQTVQALTQGRFAIWLGFGARHAADSIRQLAESTGAAVMCSPRGKGIFPEDHAQFIGVTGLGGHDSVLTYMRDFQPQHILVLGTRLGEPTSFWSSAMIPQAGFIHVDTDPAVPGVAYPTVKTLAIQSDIDVFVNSLLKTLLPQLPTQVSTQVSTQATPTVAYPRPEVAPPAAPSIDRIRPDYLMDAIQLILVENSNAIVLAESGNAFTWATNRLRFNQTRRYRVSTGVGAMGHTATGVIGAARGHQGKAVAIVGDGSMLMNNEISTAVKYELPAIWIVLNDARYNMCAQGMAMLGMTGADPTFPETDFVAIAKGVGAEGIRVEREADLAGALELALQASGPFVVDVYIDPYLPAPSRGRNQSLLEQGGRSMAHGKQISFPLVQ